ncbi:MAG: hypothetical protein NTX36_12010 [Proteobacteria bacterium]|nr:hypothetical protein [Pseudomonadota bacterium]
MNNTRKAISQYERADLLNAIVLDQFQENTLFAARYRSINVDKSG